MSQDDPTDDLGAAAAEELAGLDTDAGRSGGETVRSLSESDFPDIVQELSRARWTGTLTISHLGVTKRAMVQDGRLVFGSSSSPDDRMGELLLRTGRITLAQYLAASREVLRGKRFGTVLVEQKLLPPEDLVKIVVEHTQEVIYSLFAWTAGLARLKPGIDKDESIKLRMNTPDIILEGIRRIETWSRVARGLGGVEARYRRAADWEKQASQMKLAQSQRELLAGLEGERSVVQLCAGAAVSSFETCRTLWAFRVIGVVEKLD